METDTVLEIFDFYFFIFILFFIENKNAGNTAGVGNES